MSGIFLQDKKYLQNDHEIKVSCLGNTTDYDISTLISKDADILLLDKVSLLQRFRFAQELNFSNL